MNRDRHISPVQSEDTNVCVCVCSNGVAYHYRGWDLGHHRVIEANCVVFPLSRHVIIFRVGLLVLEQAERAERERDVCGTEYVLDVSTLTLC